MSNELIYFLLGLLFSIIFGYYFYRKSLRVKEPVYSIKSNNLISGSASTLANLNISYKKRKIENLTVSKILFYNRGSETIHRQDVETINHIGIASHVCDILDGSVLQVNNTSNNLTVHYDPGSKNVVIDFDYLDKNQGAVIQVIHNGSSSEHLGLYGDIKGVQNLVRVAPERLSTGINLDELTKRPSVMRLEIALVLTAILALWMISAIVPFTGGFGHAFEGPQYAAPYVPQLSAIIALSFLLGLYGLAPLRRNLPIGLEKFYE